MNSLPPPKDLDVCLAELEIVPFSHYKETSPVFNSFDIPYFDITERSFSGGQRHSRRCAERGQEEEQENEQH